VQGLVLSSERCACTALAGPNGESMEEGPMKNRGRTRGWVFGLALGLLLVPRARANTISITGTLASPTSPSEYTLNLAGTGNVTLQISTGGFTQ